MVEVAQTVSNAQGDSRRLSAVSPLGTARGSAARIVHHDNELHIAEEPFLSVLSIRQSRRQPDQLGISDVLAGCSLALPARPAELVGTADLSCAWIEPRAWIVTSTAAAALRPAKGIYVTDVSDRMSAFRLTGEQAVEIIASGCDPAIAPAGTCTRARFANLSAAILQCWTRNDWRILVDASLALTYSHWLQDAAANCRRSHQ